MFWSVIPDQSPYLTVIFFNERSNFMNKNKNLWFKIPRNTKCHLTKLTVLEQREEIEYERQWQEEGQKNGEGK